MFKVNILLAIFCIDYVENKILVLSTKDNDLVLPQSPINTESNLDDLLDELFFKTCHYNINWSDYRVITAYNNNESINILYMVKIPSIDIKNCFWMDANLACSQNSLLQKCILYV